MRKLWIALFVIVAGTAGAQEKVTLRIAVSVPEAMRPVFQKGGRLLFHLTKQSEREPRSRSEITIGVNTQKWDGSKPFVMYSKKKNIVAVGLDKLSGQLSQKYYYQVVYKQNTGDGNEHAVGNLFSAVDSIFLAGKNELQLSLTTVIPSAAIIQHPFVRSVQIKSNYLSAFFNKPVFLKASILLPSGYFDNPGKSYPVCYRAGGLKGRWDAVNEMMADKGFTGWWFTKEAPQVIYVFLDSQGPYGDTYQVDSDNNGPCGKALTEELIPAVEKLVGYQPETNMRYLAGRSTGGRVALGLQVFYPDFFDGAWSYSPDPVDFEHFGLIDIYRDETIFYNSNGYLQPGKRTIYGEPTFSMKEWIAGENIGSRTNDYRVSGGQFGSYNAVFGPKGSDGLPTLMFDPLTGKIDHSIAQQWEKYDLKKIMEKNWAWLGPKLQGKIWIWTGDMDGYYSNVATRFLQQFLEKTQNPRSDAKISFTAMAGHTQEWSDKAVLKMVAEKASARLRQGAGH